MNPFNMPMDLGIITRTLIGKSGAIFNRPSSDDL